jgi:hypothetical protein
MIRYISSPQSILLRACPRLSQAPNSAPFPVTPAQVEGEVSAVWGKVSSGVRFPHQRARGRQVHKWGLA